MTQTNEPNQDSTPSSLSRRVFLGAGVSAAAALAFPSVAKAQTPSTCKIVPPSSNLFSHPVFQPFCEPDPIYSQQGAVSLQLSVVDGSVTVPGPNNTSQTIRARTYNGQIPAPPIYLTPGDRIDISMTNNLIPNDPSCPDPHILNQPGCFNTTNLHFHGLHVSPSSYTNEQGVKVSSDDVSIAVQPTDTHLWCVQLPQFHAPGTHWYHAHLHGATGLQVAKGMGGSLVIRESQSLVPGKTYSYNIVDETNDKVFVIQELIGSSDCDVYDQNVTASAGQFIINGTLQPLLKVHKNQLQRWRFINSTATPRGFMTLKLCQTGSFNDNTCDCTNPATIYLMAVDGISFYGNKPRPISGDGWKLAPGNRADFLVSLQPGIYKLLKDADPVAGQPGGTTQVLAYIEVADQAPANSSAFDPTKDIIPGTFPSYLQPIKNEEICQKPSPTTVEFSVVPRSGGAGSCQKAGGFQINGKEYDPKRTDYEVKLNTAEEWQLSNKSNAPHPFHIHVNPFQIVGANTPELRNIALINPNLQPNPDIPENRIWWDTIAVPPQTPNTNPLKIWHRFLDYYGEFVIHCHVLIHEDKGMMQNVKVVNDGTGIGPCQTLTTGASPNLNPNCTIPASTSSPAQPSPQPSSSPSPAPSPKAAGNGGGGGGGRGTGGGGGGGGGKPQ